ncbi:MAG: ribosome assembly cofactor RimP [Treponema sp.]|jgi:ribosome maturation factor RimP|nr:ribosome assembly cofactor RimP [Treponema sp.]
MGKQRGGAARKRFEVRMQYTVRTAEPVFDSLEPVIRGLGMSLVELTVFRSRGSARVRAVVYKAGAVGHEDCARVHRAILPRLELAFPREELFVEVSSPGVDRLIKDGAEFTHYRGRGLRCYRTDISDWTGGVLESSDERGIVLRGKDGPMNLGYDVIAKAKLDYSQEV